MKKAVLKNLQYSQENTFIGVSSYNFIKKRVQHSCFPVNITKFSRTPILKNICEELLSDITITKKPFNSLASHWVRTKEQG